MTKLATSSNKWWREPAEQKIPRIDIQICISHLRDTGVENMFDVAATNGAIEHEWASIAALIFMPWSTSTSEATSSCPAAGSRHGRFHRDQILHAVRANRTVTGAGRGEAYEAYRKLMIDFTEARDRRIAAARL